MHTNIKNVGGAYLAPFDGTTLLHFYWQNNQCRSIIYTFTLGLHAIEMRMKTIKYALGTLCKQCVRVIPCFREPIWSQSNWNVTGNCKVCARYIV